MIRVVLQAALQRASLDDEATRPALPCERYGRRVTGRDDARKPAHAFEHAVVEGHALRVLCVLVLRKNGAERENVLRLYERVLTLKLLQRLYEEPRADEQDECERDLRDDEGVAQTTTARGRAATPAASLERFAGGCG